MTKQILSQTDIKVLSTSEQKDIKGGLLLYCEEKRRNFLGIPYTSRQWKLANDGRLWLTIRM